QPAFKPLMLAAMLTVLERPFMETAPMFALVGAQSGTGKGEIIKALSRLALNTTPPLMSWGHDDQEFKKRFDAMMLLSPVMFGIDNANGKLLSHDALEMLLTEGVITIRIFGRLENVTLRPRTTIFVNGNNLSISGDMIRRCFVIRILPRCANPESEVFEFTPSGYVAEHRNELLNDAYTIMRAFRLAGMPQCTSSSVGSFPLWERKVRDLVFWLTGY